MTRLANSAKAGYFPIPPAVTDLITTYITAPQNGRILDPCAGEGTALVTLAAKLHLTPFGVELHQERAHKAKEAVHHFLQTRLPQPETLNLKPETLNLKPETLNPVPHILHDSYLNLVTSKGGFNLLYENPPYDHDEQDGRLEYQWLVHTRQWLQPGGLLIWVVPRHLLGMKKAVRYLVSYYDQIQVYRFPDESYSQFKQVVLFGVHRSNPVPPDNDLVERLALMSSELFEMPVLSAVSEPCYTLPSLAVKDKTFKFRSVFIDPQDALAEARQQGASTGKSWREHLDPTTTHVPLRPLAPLKIGHLSSIIAAGHLNNTLLESGAEDGQDGMAEKLLIKGRSYKTIRKEQFEEPLPGGGTRITYLETEVVVTDVTTLDSTGQVKAYKGAELEQFLQRWITPLTAQVAQTYQPVYQFDLGGYGDLLNSLSKNRPIPGLNGQTGLLPAQKHAAAAALTRLETHPDVIVVGECGTGKTTVGAAIAAGRKAKRTIVLCPPHLVDKWQREFKAVWPGVRTMPLQNPADVDFFFGHQPDNTPLVGVLKQTTARSASGWEHAYHYGGPASHSYGSKGYNDIVRPWEKREERRVKSEERGEKGEVAPRSSLLNPQSPPLSYRQFLDWPTEERPFTDKQLLALHQRGVRCPVCGKQQMTGDRPLVVEELKSAVRYCSNPRCKSPLYQFTRRRADSQIRGSFRLHAQQEKLIRQYTSQNEELPLNIRQQWSGTAVKDTLRQAQGRLFGYGKTPLAAYIKKRANGRLDLLLIDEAHHYKGDDSDQGYAMHQLAQASQRVVCLTGTIYGGKASSLFHLLFRISPEVRAAYVDQNEQGQRRLRSREWVSAYGILQQIETVTLDEDGKQTANSRSSVRYKELPGGSPAMLPWLLNRSVFLSLQDMGFPLPEYSEIPLPVEMAPEQAILYESLKAQLKEELKERLVRGDKSLLSAYLYALLFWPDSPRRGKVVTCPRSDQVVASIPGLPDEFRGPKEAEIIQCCLAEKRARRKVLLLCQQTDTLDIQPQWKQMLEEAGLKTAILRAAPDKREAWVAKQVKAGVDVLISHPKKVETGLDLLDFVTIIWMSAEYSVYTVLQASRRSWRIGQSEPVKVYFYAYTDTIQEDALHLVAAKVAAALRINGDTIDTDSLAELDSMTSGDLIATLAKIVIGESKLETKSLQQAFAEANASLKQANTLIGEYTLVENGASEPETLTHSEAQQVMEDAVAEETNPAQTLTLGLLDALERVKRAVIGDENGQVGRQSSLFTNGNGRKPNGNGRSHPHENGNTVHKSLLPTTQPANGNGQPFNDKPPVSTDKPTPPPVPRPRLLRSLLRVG